MNTRRRSIFHTLLGWFVGVGVLLIFCFGSVQYWMIKRQIQQDMERSARHVVDEAVAYFDKVQAIPLQSGLRILEQLSGLDEMLRAWGDRTLLIKPEVERLFTHVLSSQKGLFLSIRYFDRQGQEMVAVSGRQRIRQYRNLNHQPDDNDPYDQQARKLHHTLQELPFGSTRFAGPFQMPDGHWTVLAGIPKWDPEIGGFAGSILLHADLTDYLRHVTALKVAGYQGARLYHPPSTPLMPPEGDLLLPADPKTIPIHGEIRLGDGEPHLTLRITFPVTPTMIDDALRKELPLLWLSALPMLLLVTGCAYLVSRRLAAPIIQLRQGMTAIGQGRFDTTLAVTTHDEIGDLAATFNHMVGDLQRMTRELERSSAAASAANQAKSLFLANMSHEIRTPMNAVIGLTDLSLQSELPPRTRDHLNKISASSRSLLRIINDILDFSKIDAGRLELEKVDFLPRELFERLADLFRLQLAEKGLELILSMAEEGRTALHGDPLRLEQILMNLIGNAIKFTPTDGEVEVSVRRVPDEEVPILLHFSVRDTGIGIPEDQAGRLFQPFSQADLSTTRTHGGTGLGLAISKRLVEMMGGRIWLESAPGQGSTFHFTAAFQHAVTGNRSDLLPPQELRHLPVLLVNRNTPSRNALADMLRLFTFEVVAVSTAQEALDQAALARAAQNPFRLIVLEESTPLPPDSLEKIRQTSIDPSRSRPPCSLLLLSNPLPPNAPRNRRHGNIAGIAHLHLIKPIHCSVLFDGIMTLFGQEVARPPDSGAHPPDLTAFHQHLHGARVLLVEDNPINQQVARENLESVGIVVDVAENGLEAIQQVTTGQYDLVLMDIQMPLMDGHAATRMIRTDPRLQHLPILAMTAHALENDQQASLEAGMNDHLTKPIDRKRLFETLNRWIGPRPFQRPEPSVSAVGADAAARIAMPEPPPLPGIDSEALLEMIHHKQALLWTLLTEFQNHYTTVIQTLRGMLLGRRVNDLEQASRLIHAFKGSAGNLYAMALFEAARELEMAIRSDQRHVWPLLLDRLETELATVLASIAHWLLQDEAKTSEYAAPPPEALTTPHSDRTAFLDNGPDS
ncbi:MAG: response regulator [Magnetococcales bacterium]|nr:response regulator [Magnetococcales bacterium]